MPLHWPGYNYLGPGTKDFKKKPINAVDSIAREHDIKYSNSKSDQDIFQADEEAISDFWTEFSNNPSLASLAGASGLSIKHYIEKNLLNRSIYPSMPPKKDWATIRKINQARAAKRNNPDEPEAGPSKRVPEETQAERPEPIAEEFESDDDGFISFEIDRLLDMANNEVPQQDQPMQAAMGRGGGNSGGGVANNGIGDVYSGYPQESNQHIKEFTKSYHFSLSNGLPRWRRALDTVYGRVNQMQYPNIHCLPWHLLAWYCSEGEISRLWDNYSMATVVEVETEVYSLGIRLPFVTGQTVSQVANALAQYPVGKFHFDRDFLVHSDPLQDLATVTKCIGTQWQSTLSSNTEWSAEFDNLTASATNRTLSNPAIVNYPISVEAGGSQMFPKDCSVYDYVNIKNGSTSYGKLWHEKYKPKQGILFAKSSEALSDRSTTGGTHPVFFNGGVHQAAWYGSQVNRFLSGMDINSEASMPAYLMYSQPVENTMVYSVDDAKISSRCMPKFMIGMVNIRNLAEGSSDPNTILEGRWDIMVKTKIKISCIDNATRGYINRVPQNVPFVYNPFLRLRDTEVTSTYQGYPSYKTYYGKAGTTVVPQPAIKSEQQLTEHYDALIKEKRMTKQYIVKKYKKILEYISNEKNPYKEGQTDYTKTVKALIEKYS